MVEKLTRDEIETTDVNVVSWDIIGREQIKTYKLVDCVYKGDPEIYTQPVFTVWENEMDGIQFWDATCNPTPFEDLESIVPASKENAEAFRKNHQDEVDAFERGLMNGNKMCDALRRGQEAADRDY